MYLFMAREAVDTHSGRRRADRPRVLGRSRGGRESRPLRLVVQRWLGWGRWPRYAGFGRLATHVRFIERSSRKLARESFHGMAIHQARMQTKQAFLFRLWTWRWSCSPWRPR
jgi:hypothetical protein